MSRPEFLAWREFYTKWPFDDMHRYFRPAAMIAQSFAGGEIEKKLEWLQPKPEVEPAPGSHQYSAGELLTLKTFGIRR